MRGELFGGASARSLGEQLIEDPVLLTRKAELWIPVSSKADVAAKGDGDPAIESAGRQGRHAKSVSTPSFLTASDATDPSVVGVWGALKGSFLTILVTMALAFPIGVLAALYLEEFAPRNRWTDMIEVSINNLAAVPSIIFGLLGLAVFLNFMHLPRSAPLVGGLTLALMTMPVIVIAGRNAIKSVPPSIRDAALGVGASKMQVVFHHVLAAGAARHPHRHDYRHGPRARRDRAAADDRHARLHRFAAVRASPNPPACCRSRFSSGPTKSTAASSRRPARPSSCCWSSCC